MTSPPLLQGGFQPKFIELFLWRSSSKIVHIVPLRCTKWPPELKIEEKNFKQNLLPQFASNDISSVTTGRTSTKLDRIIPWEVFYQNCSNRSAPLHKMATRAKNRKYFKRHLLGGFQSNMIGLFLGRSSTKIAQIVLLCCTKWPPELKIEKKKTSNDISAVTMG